MNRKLIAFLMFMVVCFSGHTDVRLPSLFSSDMVLQRNADLEIWGWADAGERVEVTLKGKSYKTKANKNGSWSVVIGRHSVGGPYEVRISGKNELLLENVLFGDVWICSGQSNMEWPLTGDYYGEKAIAEANYPNIRLFKVAKKQSQYPQQDVSGEWKECSPETVAKFSAVGYYFGKEIHQSQDVPVGLIQAAWGGSGIISWMSADAFDGLSKFKEDIALLQSEQNYLAVRSAAYDKELTSWFEQVNDQSSILNTPEMLDEGAMQQVEWIPTEMPKVWERTAIGDFDGLVWFKTSFEGDRFLQDEETFLSLGKLDDHDMVFLNGQRIGHGGWKEWGRFYAMPDSLMKGGKNELVVGVIDYGGEGGFSGGINDLFIDSFDKEKVNARYPLPSEWAYVIDSYSSNKVKPVWLGGIVEPTILYNAMLAPLTRFPVKGAIWYQGERSKATPDGYDILLKTLIKDWRNQWGQEELPFFFVQLPNYDNEPGQYPAGNWAVLRSNQARGLELPNTGMAVTYDVGDPHDIHPLLKEPVGHRLALAARKAVYNENVVHSGPVLKEVNRTNKTLRITFETYGEEMLARDPYKYVRGFELGYQKESGLATIPVQARIEGDEIVIDLQDIGEPDLIRYAWQDNPDANLYNESGLPAPPFEYQLDQE